MDQVQTVSANQPHTSEEVYESIRHLAAQQSANEAKLQQFMTVMEQFSREVKDELRALRYDQTRPTNWIGIASLIAIIIAGGVTYFNQGIAPLQQAETRRHSFDEQQIDRAIDYAKSDAYQRAMIDSLVLRVSALEKRDEERE